MRLRGLRLRVCRRRTVRRYSPSRLLGVALLALAAALPIAWTVASLMAHGRLPLLFAAASRNPVSLLSLQLLLPWILLASSLAWPLASRFARRPAAQALSPGMYHYSGSHAFGAKRLHLRVEADGSAVLMIDAYRIVHLNPTAALMVKQDLDGHEEKAAVARLAAHLRMPGPRVRRDYRATLAKIDRLVRRDDLCPVSFFDVQTIDAFQTPVSAPYRMDLALTYRCNVNCGHCYNQRRESGELSTSEWQEAMRRLWRAGVPHVAFTGGEPTLRNDLADLVEFAENLGMVTGLLSNGVLLADAARTESLRAAGLDYVQVTVESADAGIHDGMVGASAHSATVAGIRNVLSRGIHLLTNTTITHRNRDGIERLPPFLKELGVSSMAVNSIIKAGRSRHGDDGFAEEELTPLITGLARQAADLGLKFTWYTPTRYCRMNPVELDLGPKQCTAGKYNLAIEPDGTVIPCQSFYRPLGHILTDSWDALYRGDFLEGLRRRDWKPEMCGDCPWLPLCGGGCPLQVTADSYCCPDLLSNP